jgi:hypothetical protein
VPLSRPMLPCGWVSTFCSDRRSSGPISDECLRARQGWSPSRGASSFSDSLTTIPQVTRPASQVPHPWLPHPPPRTPFRAHGWEPNRPQHRTRRLTRASCWSVERLRSGALLLLEVRSRRLQAALLDDGRCSPGLRPSRAFPQPALNLVFFASGCAPPGPPALPFTGTGGTVLLSRPFTLARTAPNER